MLVDLDVPDAPQVDPGRGLVRLRIPPAPVAVLRPLDSVEPSATLEPRVAGSLVRPDPAEERGERRVQSPQGGLLGTERPTSLPGAVGVPDLLELRGLAAIADRHPAHPVRLAPFFQCSVVQLPVILDAGGQGPRLARGGADLELVGALHFSCSFRQGRSYWVSMYSCTVDAETAPTVATKYDRDHRVGSRDLRCENSSRSTRDVSPLNWLATCDGESAG